MNGTTIDAITTSYCDNHTNDDDYENDGDGEDGQDGNNEGNGGSMMKIWKI
jgi:hypothetical protein